MSFLVDYAKALMPKPGVKPGVLTPRIETILRASPVDRVLYQRLRKEWSLADYGVLPPIFHQVATFRTHLKNLTDRRFPINPIGLVHTRTLVEQIRPVRVDELVTYRCFIDGQREVERGLEFDLVTETLVGGDLVSTITSTMLRKPRKQTSSAKQPFPVHNHVNARTAIWHVNESTARSYAVVSGDINPIHLTTVAARLFGFEGMILHGMWTLGKACAMHPIVVMKHAVKVRCEFKLPVQLPATLMYRWWETDTGIEMRVLSHDGSRPHMVGSIEF